MLFSGSGFNTSLGAQQVLMYQKSMFDRYYCIKHFFRSKTRNCLKKCFLPVPIMARKLSTSPANVLNVIATVHFTDDDVSFYDGPGMHFCKTTKPCINST